MSVHKNETGDLPPVTAIMITGKSKDRQMFARASVESFKAQTYPHKELVIVNDSCGTDHEYRVLYPHEEGSNMREVFIEPYGSLGALRNLAMDAARTEWLIQWDDDDFYHPERINYQMKNRYSKFVVLLLYQIRYSFASNCGFELRYDRPDEGIPGTMLFHKTNKRFQEVGKHEDSRFLNDAFGRDRVILANGAGAYPFGPNLYLRFFHGHNTWDERHIMRQMFGKQDEWQMPNRCQQYLRHVLTTYYPWAGIPKLPEQT